MGILAVPVLVRVIVTDPEPLMLFGMEHVTPVRLVGTEQLSETVPLKLFTAAIATVTFAELPEASVRLAGFTVIAKSSLHSSTRFCTLMEPRPVAWSYPVPALYPNVP